MKIKSRFEHSVNGAFQGWWIELDTGVAMYLAYRKGLGRKVYYPPANAWFVELSTLNRAKDRGIETIGLIHQEKNQRHYYATPVEDLFGEYSLVHPWTESRQRCLPRQCWRVTPLASEAYLQKVIRLR